MLSIVGIIFPVFALIFAGWAVGRPGTLPTSAVDALNGFVVRLALPVLMFQFVAEADWATLWHPGFVLALTGGIAVVFAVTYGLAPRDRSMAARSVEGLTAAYANTAFMGIPICQALFGEAGLAAAVIASLLTVCIAFAFSILLVEIDLHRAKGVWHAARQVSRSLARNPLVLGPVMGLAWALTGIILPGPIHRLATLLGAAASPVALVTIGLFLAVTPRAAAATRLWPLILAKLVGQPLATLALVWLLGVPQPWGLLAVLIAAMPTGTGPFMLAKLYDREAGTVARVLLVTTLASALTIPLLLLLFRAE